MLDSFERFSSDRSVPGRGTNGRRGRFEWMAIWAAKNHLQLELEGKCGFGRDCVGVLGEGVYPDYEWYDDEYNRIDLNGEVWTPPDAYHKHPCVAVLGRGEEAEEQLYQWLKWFEDNGFVPEMGVKELSPDKASSPITYFLRQHVYARMVRKSAAE